MSTIERLKQLGHGKEQDDYILNFFSLRNVKPTDTHAAVVRFADGTTEEAICHVPEDADFLAMVGTVQQAARSKG